jgi:hypothetical protein
MRVTSSSTKSWNMLSESEKLVWAAEYGRFSEEWRGECQAGRRRGCG